LSVLAIGTGLAIGMGVPAGPYYWFNFLVAYYVCLFAIVALTSCWLLYRLVAEFTQFVFRFVDAKFQKCLRKSCLAWMYLFIFIIFSAHYTLTVIFEPFLSEMVWRVAVYHADFTVVLVVAHVSVVYYLVLGEKLNKRDD